MSASSLVLGLIGLTPAASAQGDTITPLSITSFYQMVADPAHGYLFISQGSSTNDIVVTNLAGKQVATIPGQDGVMGIAISPDGSTLYAALSASHAVSAIDTSTLVETASYSLGSTDTPQNVAVQSGKVWVSYGTPEVPPATPPAAQIGDINLSASPPAFETQDAMAGWSNVPELAADPQDAGVLVAVEPDTSPVYAATYNVSTDPPTVLNQPISLGVPGPDQCDFVLDLAVAAGGSEFTVACQTPDSDYRYSTADLSQQGSYPGAHGPVAVAVDSNGDVAVGARRNLSGPNVFIYRHDSDTPLNTYDLSTSGALLMDRGLAWAPDGSQLFAVLQTGSGFSLRALAYPTLVHSTLKLSGPSTASIKTPVILTGTLTLGNGQAPPAGSTIAIKRTAAGGTNSQDFTVTTGASGTFTLTDTPPATGRYTYTASYSGTSAIAPATASHAVTVALLTIATRGSTFSYESKVGVTAHLGPTATNRTVSIYAQPFGSKSKTLLKRGSVDSHGNLTTTYKAARSTTISAVFSGDASDAHATATKAIRVLAKVSETLSGYYGSRRIGPTTYRLFHRKNLMRVVGTVAPNKAGECVKFEAQEFYRRAWHANVTTGCATLNKSSTAHAKFNLTHADVGYRYRIRADYVRSGRDDSNLSNDSAWQYLIVEK